MRTTVTLDDDVAREVKRLMQAEGKSFKEALNESLRLHFASRQPVPTDKRKPFKVRARHMKLREGIDPARISDLLNDLDDEKFLRVLSQYKK